VPARREMCSSRRSGLSARSRHSLPRPCSGRPARRSGSTLTRREVFGQVVAAQDREGRLHRLRIDGRVKVVARDATVEFDRELLRLPITSSSDTARAACRNARSYGDGGNLCSGCPLSGAANRSDSAEVLCSQAPPGSHSRRWPQALEHERQSRVTNQHARTISCQPRREGHDMSLCCRSNIALVVGCDVPDIADYAFAGCVHPWQSAPPPRPRAPSSRAPASVAQAGPRAGRPPVAPRDCSGCRRLDQLATFATGLVGPALSVVEPTTGNKINSNFRILKQVAQSNPQRIHIEHAWATKLRSMILASHVQHKHVAPAIPCDDSVVIVLHNTQFNLRRATNAIERQSHAGSW
jgi:hypothetical protein